MKNLSIGIVFALLSTNALAQVPEYTVKITQPELNLIGRGLGGLPYNDVADLVNKLRSQIMEQQQQAQPKVIKPVDPPKVEAPKTDIPEKK